MKEASNKTTTVKNQKSDNIRSFILVGIIVVVWAILTVLTKGNFLTMRNISNLLRQMSMVGIMTCGMVLVIVSGGIDLSVGAVAGCLGMLAAAGMEWWGWSTGFTIVVMLVAGMVIGLVQGIIIAYGSVPQFIATLGGMLILQGCQVAISKGTTISPLNEDFVAIGQSYIGKTWTIIVAIVGLIAFVAISIIVEKSRKKHGLREKGMAKIVMMGAVMAVFLIGFTMLLNTYESMPLPVLLMVITVVVMKFVSENTTFGRNVYAIGGNIKAAEYAGIHVRRTTVFIYVVNAILATLAGMILAARLNAGSSSAGHGMEMQVIAGAVIGGTRMSGGYGKVTGAILGALFMATLTNGMSLLNLQSYWQDIVQGIVLVAAVFIDKMTSKTN
jgi:D-xylose transport system permease protein